MSRLHRPPTDEEHLAIRVANRFADSRAMFRLDEALSLLSDDVTIVTLDNVVHGIKAARNALLDQSRFRNIVRYFDSFSIVNDDEIELPLSGHSRRGKNVFVVERRGRMYRSLQWIDFRFMYVRETIVCDRSGHIRFYCLQRRE